MRVALFGGTFDPPHRGHLAIAKAAADAFELDSVLFAPVGRQPLKLQQASSSYTDRLAMVTLACSESADGRFSVSDVDSPRSDGLPNYTVHTLAGLAAALPAGALFSLIGADSFGNMGHWHSPERLLELAEWIVVSRPGFLFDLPAGLKVAPAKLARIHLLDGVLDVVSATALRARLGAGEDCLELICPSVARYIQEHGLYRQARGGTLTTGRSDE